MTDGKKEKHSFEIFVQPGFSELELASVVSVLRTANDALNKDLFSWYLTSDSPGFVESSTEILARAHPAIGDQYLRDCLFVIAGRERPERGWMVRVKAMQRLQRRAVLLSEAARKYVQAGKSQDAPVTAHWRDVTLLREAGDYPSLSERLGEEDGGVLTCAGHGHTVEAVIGVLGDFLEPRECAEIAEFLVVETVRDFSQEQPKVLSSQTDYLDRRLQKAVDLMERSVEEPLPLPDLAYQVGVSSRHLERLFIFYLKTSPAKFYKKVRLRRARVLVQNTNLSLIEIALACGFQTAATFSRAFRIEYGKTPAQHRKGDPIS
ncbi:GlxA family transcriptional regulator [Roseibium sp.]|uniref:GlxA family transcriptional regulator n=1 Tax=Roseibium sp. TaxID=1936156 RepID=UPI003D123D8C